MLTQKGLHSSGVFPYKEQEKRRTSPFREGPAWSWKALADTTCRCQCSFPFLSWHPPPCSPPFTPRRLLKTPGSLFPCPIKRLPPKGLGTSKITQNWAFSDLRGHICPTAFNIRAKSIIWQRKPPGGKCRKRPLMLEYCLCRGRLRLMYRWRLLCVIASKNMMTKCHKASSEMYRRPSKYMI